MNKWSINRVLAIMLAIFTASITVSAESSQVLPYESYTYWENGSVEKKAVYSRTMYEVVRTIGNKELGVFGELVDVCVDNNGYIYLLDSKTGIVILDKEYNFVTKIEKVVKSNGEECLFSNLQGVTVINDKIYICDTNNARVLVCNRQAKYIDEYILPTSPLIPDNFDFKPKRVAVNRDGYVYILSDGSYYGALLYAPNKDFICFYGANTVTNGILGSIKSLINRMFPSNAKASNSQRQLPFTFTDLVIDSKGFVYTATDSGNEGQIKKLNPGLGNNVLGSDDVNFVDEVVNRDETTGKILYQRIVALDVDENENIYALDSTYGRIFVYDSQCRIITTLGGGMGKGTQKGNFINASAIAINDNNDILACDKSNNTLTVFKCNDFGEKVFKLLNKTNKGDYNGTQTGWQEILKEDKNLQIAYSGLARSYLANDEYYEAMNVAKQGSDRETYAIAFEYYRNEKLSKNFTMYFISFIILAIVLITLFIFLKKKNVIKNQKLKIMLSTVTSPSNSFEAIKEKNLGSVKLSIGVLIVYYVVSILSEMCAGFLYNNFDALTFNSFYFLLRSAGLVVLWSGANWLICTLNDGKGKFKEIIIVTCYSLVPLIFGKLIWLFLSNFLLPTESVILSIVNAISILFFLLLMIIGMMRIHEYTLIKLIGTSTLTLLGMAAIVFLCVLVLILIQQLGGFAATIFTEMFM